MIIPHVGKMGCCMAALTSAATSKFGSCYPGFVSRTSTSVVFPSHIISGALQVRGGQAVEAALESRESLHHLVVNIRHLDSPRDERCFAVVDIHQILQRTKPLRLEFLYHFYNRVRYCRCVHCYSVPTPCDLLEECIGYEQRCGLCLLQNGNAIYRKWGFRCILTELMAFVYSFMICTTHCGTTTKLIPTTSACRDEWGPTSWPDRSY